MSKQISLSKHHVRQLANVIRTDIKAFIESHKSDFEKFLCESLAAKK